MDLGYFSSLSLIPRPEKERKKSLVGIHCLRVGIITYTKTKWERHMTITRNPSNCRLDVLLLLPIHVFDNVTYVINVVPFVNCHNRGYLL